MEAVRTLSADRDEDERFWQLALAVNAAFKGLLGSMNQSGHICASVAPMKIHLELESGWDAVLGRIVHQLGLMRIDDGDVIVVADKVLAVALGRIAPRALLESPDPKTVDSSRLDALAHRWQLQLGFPVTPLHLMLADELGANMASLGCDNHNFRSHQIAAEIRQHLCRSVDVVISDTDTGLDTRTPLIGMVTIGATPLGATAGVNLYEAMRCAVAAEFARGHTKSIPVVVCRPADRRRQRSDIGSRRYDGALHVQNESHIGHA